MYSMKEACALTGMTYENLKFYCKEGLVPNVKRDSRNYRVFDDHDIKWIQSLGCLRNCGLSIAEMKEYLHLCLEGEATIPARKEILFRKKEALLTSMQRLQGSTDLLLLHHGKGRRILESEFQCVGFYKIIIIPE